MSSKLVVWGIMHAVAKERVGSFIAEPSDFKMQDLKLVWFYQLVQSAVSEVKSVAMKCNLAQSSMKCPSLLQFMHTTPLMIQAFDLRITLLLSQLLPHAPFFDSIFRFLSAEGAYLIVWPIVAFVAFLIEYFEHKKRDLFLRKMIRVFIVLSVTALVAFGTVHFLIKPVFERQRPYKAQSITAPYCPKDYSFPSGHAAIAWAGAYILIKFDTKRKREIAYFLIAAFVSYSRIYLSCHYFGDVLAGAAYGVLVGALCFETYRRFFLTDKQLKIKFK